MQDSVKRQDRVSIRPRCSGHPEDGCDVDLGRIVDRMLLPVTAAIYQNGVERTAMR